MSIEENPFNHVLYEFSMYLQTLMYSSNDQFIINLMVDSRMLHMRNIAYFFSSERDRAKNYLHYSMFINNPISQEIEHELFSKIQRITSNSACHLLKGRIQKTFKQEVMEFEKETSPIIVLLIKSFLDELNSDIRDEYKADWEDSNICEGAKELKFLINKYEILMSLKI